MSSDTPCFCKNLTEMRHRSSHLTWCTNIGLHAVSARLSENINSGTPPGSTILHVYISHTPQHSRFQQGLKAVQNVTCSGCTCLHSLHPTTHTLRIQNRKRSRRVEPAAVWLGLCWTQTHAAQRGISALISNTLSPQKTQDSSIQN